MRVGWRRCHPPARSSSASHQPALAKTWRSASTEVGWSAAPLDCRRGAIEAAPIPPNQPGVADRRKLRSLKWGWLKIHKNLW